MAIVFKTLKYKHFKRALELNRQIEAGEVDEDVILQFVVSLVDKWDFVDVETDKPLSFDDIDEMSLDQYNQLMEMFNAKMGVANEVPKASGEQSPSGSTKSKAATAKKSPPKRQSG